MNRKSILKQDNIEIIKSSVKKSKVYTLIVILWTNILKSHKSKSLKKPWSYLLTIELQVLDHTRRTAVVKFRMVTGHDWSERTFIN